MTDNVSKIKDRLDIVDVISGYLKVQKSGINFKACCPFHNEKTPSFYISPERQIWHCFGCSKGGDMFSFVKEIESVEFPEALRILAQKAGVEIEQHDPMVQDGKNKLYQVAETAVRFFEKQLHESNYGKKALGYLLDRSLKTETIKQFRLGYAPNDWYSLNKFLINSGFSKKEIIDAGLALQKEGKTDIYDRFRSRIMFPIFDLNGQAVGFTGRVFDADQQPTTNNSQQSSGSSVISRQSSVDVAKYINTPQTQIYDKSRILYGLDKAKTEVKINNCCVLVEGNMDMLMSYQAGVKNVIASSGTALTPSHLKLLQRYTNNLNFCFDADQAGAMATKRGIGLALQQNFNINVISIDDKECKDPADYVKKYDSKWSEIVGTAKPVVEFYFNKAKQEIDVGSPEGKKSAILALAPFIKRLASEVERSHWLSQLAFLLRVPDGAVKADIYSVKDELDAYERGTNENNLPVYPPKEDPLLENKNGPQIMGPDIYNETLLSVIIKNPNLFKGDLKDLPNEVHPFVKDIASKIEADLNTTSQNEKFNFDVILKTLNKEEAMRLEFAHLRSQELWKEFKEEELKDEYHGLVNKIKHRALTAQLATMEFDIKEAENSGDKNKINLLMAKFNTLTQELSQLQV